MSRIKRKVLCALGVVLLLTGAQLYLYRNYMIIAPGIALDLSDVVSVEGRKATPGGTFLLTAVSSRQANLVTALVALANPYIDMVPLVEEVPRGMDMRKYLEIMARMMEESQMVARAVALRHEGYKVNASTQIRVEEVLDGSPARGKLKVGDVITHVDRRPVRTAQETVSLIQERKIGESVLITVRRGESTLDFKIPTITHQENKNKAAIGVIIAPYMRYEFPIKIDINVMDIKGSSAGLMFCLEILDQMRGGELSRGHVIAGTGTLDIDGKVGAIAGVKQKVVASERKGAAVFFTPVENAEEAKSVARRIRVVPVRDLGDALDFLNKLEPKGQG